MSARSTVLSVPLAGLLVGLAIVLGGCDGAAMLDAGTPDTSFPQCATNDECSDGVFCNGAEECSPDDDTADQRGCIVGARPCATGMRCEEGADRCSDCTEPDADGDGVAAVECGGADCDDEDPLRFPGAVEVCDLEERDEDCDPTTLGHDRDGDSFASSACCNRQRDGTRVCGRDCADDRPAVNPNATEVCNGFDEDCDVAIDEGVPHVIFPDGDGDGFGISEFGQSACTLPVSGGFTFLGGDCDDGVPTISPAAGEVCGDDLDNDCDGAVDQGCACDRPGMARSCGPRLQSGGLQSRGACRSGEQACLDGVWSDCVGDQAPAPELCDGVDDDCDGFIDEGVVSRFYLDADDDGYGDPTRPNERCTAPVGHVLNNFDCDDRNPVVSPDGTEMCNGDDDDCDKSFDEGTDAMCDAELSGSVCVDGECVGD